jgi:low affinity Fe/Cu permease
MNVLILLSIFFAVIGVIMLLLGFKAGEHGGIKLVYSGSVVIVIAFMIFYINLQLRDIKAKKDYLIKIEQVLSKKNVPNKELIVKELKNKTLEELQEYYLKKLEE